ncbi:MAG: hypothetical protein GC201_01025 [Alphaproteobacteria bacterium]|nr:hypothetical protein [Alphaproteobacteria bacterium]
MSKTVTNISNGPRGFWAGGRMITLEPGQHVEDPNFADEDIAALAEEWFKVTDGVPAVTGEPDGDGAPADDDQPNIAGKTKAELLEIASAEGVEGVDEHTKNDDIRAAIEAHREAAEG